MDLGHHVVAIDADRSAARRPQRDVQDGALFGQVNFVAAEHRVDAPAQPRLFGQREQQADCLVGHAMLGIVEVQAGGLDDEPFTALGIFGEQSLQVAAVDLVVMRLQCLPRSAPGQRVRLR